MRIKRNWRNWSVIAVLSLIPLYVIIHVISMTRKSHLLPASDGGPEHRGGALNDASTVKTWKLLDRNKSLNASMHWSQVQSSHGRPPWHSETVEMNAEQKSRLATVADACRRLVVKPLTIRQMRSTAVFDNMFADDQRRYIFCRIGKVASTTWSRVLLLATGKLKITSPNQLSQSKTYSILRSGRILRSLSRYSDNGIRTRLKMYFKFVFVRHPLDRMISAFYDRLMSDHQLPKSIYTNKIKKYRMPGETNKTGLRLVEFVRYLVDPATRRTGYNPHWKPQYDRSLPCHIPYDFIGHYETLQEDAEYILRWIRADPRVKFPSKDRDNLKRTNATERMIKALAEIQEREIHLLKTEVYGNDLEVFGYQ